MELCWESCEGTKIHILMIGWASGEIDYKNVLIIDLSFMYLIKGKNAKHLQVAGV